MLYRGALRTIFTLQECVIHDHGELDAAPLVVLHSFVTRGIYCV